MNDRRQLTVQWTRRGLLAVAGITVAGVSGGLLAYFGIRSGAPSVSGLRVLTDNQYATLAAVVETLFPAGGPIPVVAADLDLPRAFDGYVADEPAAIAEDLSLAIDLLEVGPTVFDGRASTFWQLDQSEREAHLASWAEADELERRQVAAALRKFFNLVYYDHPEVWPHIGYAGTLRIPVSR